MAPDAIHPQVLSLQWDLAWPTLNLSTVKMPAHNGYSPVTPERPAADLSTVVSPKPSMLQTFPMFRNLQQYLWGALQRVLRRLLVTKELLSSTRVFLFLCSSYRAQAAMKGDAEKRIMGRGGAEGEKVVETRPDQISASMLKTQVEEEMEVLKRRTVDLEGEEEKEERETEAEDMEEFTDDEEESDSDWMEWGSEEEDDGVEDEDALHQQTIPTTGSCVRISLNSKQANEEEEEGNSDEEEDSEWSEEEDEDDDSEASAESVELWESFLQSDDPYNPLSFSSCMTSRTSSNTHTSTVQESAENNNTSPVNGESRADDWEEEEKQREDRRHSTHSIQQKKVRFSDEVTVHPLVDWALASRDARDGSCWMAMARDRARFRRRVEDAGKVISLCLSPEHRCLVWEKLQKQSAL